MNAKEPGPVFVNGIQLHCNHCGSDRFSQRMGQVNTATLTFFDLDWLDPSANLCICVDCGHVHWFLGLRPPTGEGVVGPDPEERTRKESTAPTECLSCGTTIPAGESACPKCGWSYA